YDRNNLLTIAADKLASKDFVSEICPSLYIPQTLWQSSNYQDLNAVVLSSLPPNYVFKANHTSQTLEIIRNNNQLPLDLMKKKAKSWLKKDQSKTLGEWAYANIPRKIFIEEFLDFNNNVPDDYKFFVFHGKVKFIQFDSGRFTRHKRNMLTENWQDLGFDYSHPRQIPTPPKPTFLKEMIDISEKIGKHFDFVRVDLYYYNNQITFGELTIYPGAGFEKFPDEYWDIYFGKYWDIK
ncbi:TPA: ATP-grasp fold amidoligase family protein, partial [Proteus mirabilis]